MIFTHATEKRGAVRTETHRFVVEDGKRQLYDMIRDPRQQTDIAGEHPDLANALASAYIESYRDVARGGLETPPIEIGHREMKRVELSAPEARLSGGLRYMARSGYAHDWIVNWKSELASASWDIEVVRAGRYALDMLYACPQKNVGVETQAEIDGAILRAAISAAHDPPPRPSPDLYPRHEAYEKEWAVLPLGEAALREGRSQLTIRATKIPGEEAMELKAVRIVALDE